MKPGLAYIHQFKNVEGKTVTTTIYDTSFMVSDDVDVILYTLPASGRPLRLSTKDTGEDKHTTIKAKQLTIEFNSDLDVNLSTFADGPDDRFKVVSTIEEGLGSQTIFEGFLVLDDNKEAFLPNTNIVTLTATDKLGALKDIPWTDDDNAYPVGKFKLGVIIAQCLKKTGLSLAIKCVNNLRHGTGQSQFLTTFSSVSNTAIVNTDSGYFYNGMEIITTGTANNNSTDIVNLVEDGAGVKVLHLDRTITVSEASVNATFTDTSSQKHFYDAIYLDAKTFEAKINEAENCYSVLQKILGEDCFLTQWQGQWWIMRVDEFDGNPPYVATFDADGVFGQFDGAADFDKNVGFTEDIYLSDEATEVSLQREHGFVKETYDYSNPEEIPCNSDFSRGEIIGAVDPDDSRYEIDCWTLVRTLSQPVTSTAFIRRVFEDGYEKNRYAVITPASDSGTPWNYLKSDPIPVGLRDKVTVSVDYRWSANASGGGVTYYPMLIYLLDNSGEYWHWWNSSTTTDESTFFWTGPETSEQNRYIPVNWVLSDVDETEWRTLTVLLDRMPAEGELYIGLLQMNQSGSGFDDVDAHYANLRVDYEPYINDSYQRYSGQYNQIDRTDTQGSGIITTNKYLVARDKQVFISDSPKKIFKGAMLFHNGTRYILAQKYFTSHAFGQSFPPGPEYCVPYGQTQVFAVFNQYRNANRIFQYKYQGRNDGFGLLPPDLLNKYFITDNNIHSNDRHFMLLTFDHDLFLCESTGTMSETYRTDLGKLYGDVFSFKYISSNQ